MTEFFLRHMTMDQRHLLMTERPLLYARIFPDVDRDQLIEIVRNAMEGIPILLWLKT
jgi:hypothetical protein